MALHNRFDKQRGTGDVKWSLKEPSKDRFVRMLREFFHCGYSIMVASSIAESKQPKAKVNLVKQNRPKKRNSVEF